MAKKSTLDKLLADVATKAAKEAVKNVLALENVRADRAAEQRATKEAERAKARAAKEAAKEAARNKHVSERAAIDWTTIPKLCPQCTKVKMVLPDFGLAQRRNGPGPQGNCRACRKGLDYSKAPRKYNTRNGGPGDAR